jgi:hypothetical protein
MMMESASVGGLFNFKANVQWRLLAQMRSAATSDLSPLLGAERT